MHKKIIQIAAVLGALSVGLGAFAAHGLKKLASPEMQEVFETGVRYQFYHVFALLFLARLYEKYHNKYLKAAVWLFFAGIILFSGSLYLMTFMNVKNIGGFEWIGPLTPVGGVAFIAGWISMALGMSPKETARYRNKS